MNRRFTVAAVQAAYVLLDRDATVSRVESLVAEAAGLGAELVVFPEAFIPGTPLWMDSQPIWDGAARLIRFSEDTFQKSARFVGVANEP